MNRYYEDDLLDLLDFESNLVTNFNKIEEPLYRKAIEEFGWGGLYIESDAYWRNGHKDPTLSALKTKDPSKDLSEFWRIVRRMQGIYC